VSGFVLPVRRQPPLVVGYEHFRLESQGAQLSPQTLIYYDETVLPFLRWLEADGVRRFDGVDVERVRTFSGAAAVAPSQLRRYAWGFGSRVSDFKRRPERVRGCGSGSFGRQEARPASGPER
jgi:hypothetical protein